MEESIITLESFLTDYWWVLVLVGLWTLPWKGVALWKAAKQSSVIWFFVLLVVNTVGLLEILYIFIFSKKRVLGGDEKEY